MSDFPTSIWMREPVIDGRPYPGGALNRAMALLSQARDEITAIETKLGTNVHGSAASLATRLAVHHSPSGIRRGNVYSLRGPNSVGGARATVEDWWLGGSTYMQVGQNAFHLTTTGTITFPSAYFAGNPPQYVICKYMTQDSGIGSTLGKVGSAQALYDSITVTQFQFVAKQIISGGTWQNAGSGDDYTINWIALGGAPA
jgi:hypothetical protein